MGTRTCQGITGPFECGGSFGAHAYLSIFTTLHSTRSYKLIAAASRVTGSHSAPHAYLSIFMKPQPTPCGSQSPQPGPHEFWMIQYLRGQVMSLQPAFSALSSL